MKEPRKQWFYGIGIREYSEIGDVHNAVKDVEDLFSVLLERYGFCEVRSRFLLNGSATRERIIQLLREAVQEVGAGDSAVIYFAGHGQYDDLLKRGYWVPSDAKHETMSSLVANDEVLSHLRQFHAQHVLLISDSCFSGSVFRGHIGKGTANDLDGRKSRWAICSGRHDQRVLDGYAGGNSPFAAALLSTLRTNEQAFLSVSDLAGRVINETREQSMQLPRGSALADVGDEGGEFIFRLNDRHLARKDGHGGTPVRKVGLQSNDMEVLSSETDSATALIRYSGNTCDRVWLTNLLEESCGNWPTRKLEIQWPAKTLERIERLREYSKQALNHTSRDSRFDGVDQSEILDFRSCVKSALDTSEKIRSGAMGQARTMWERMKPHIFERWAVQSLANFFTLCHAKILWSALLCFRFKVIYDEFPKEYDNWFAVYDPGLACMRLMGEQSELFDAKVRRLSGQELSSAIGIWGPQEAVAEAFLNGADYGPHPWIREFAFPQYELHELLQLTSGLTVYTERIRVERVRTLRGVVVSYDQLRDRYGA